MKSWGYEASMDREMDVMVGCVLDGRGGYDSGSGCDDW